MDENKEPVRERDDLSVALNYGSNWEETSLSYAISRASNSLASDGSVALLVDYIDFLLEHLADLLSRDDSSEIPPKDQVESLHELMFVKTLLRTTPMQYIDDENSHQKHIGAQVNKVARLIEDLYVGNLNEEMITMKNSILVRLLGRLKFINLTSIVEQVNHETGMVVSMRDQFETLCFDMRLLRAFLIDTQRDYTVDKKFDNIQSHIEAVGLKTGSSIYSFYTKEIKGGMAEEMCHLQPEFLEKINVIKANICKILPGATSTNFWKISGQRGMTILLKELNKPLYSRADTISRFVKPHVEKAARLWTENFQNGLKFLISFLENFDEQCIEIGELKTLEECIMNMANGAKYATDPIFLRENPFWHCMLKLYDVMEEVKLIKKEINRINENFSGEKLSAMSEVVVGFEDEAKNIIDN